MTEALHTAERGCPGTKVRRPQRCIALGISTGGPPALATLVSRLVPPLPPLVIVQHMPPQFTAALAARLDGLCGLRVVEASDREQLQPNCVYIAPGGRHLEVAVRGPRVVTLLSDGPPVSGHRPSVDVLMTSAAAVFGSGCLGVIMTGMGHDGVKGCEAIRRAGGYVLGQDEATSEVYGMNRAAWLGGHVDQQFALADAAAAIARCLGAGATAQGER